MDFIAQICSPTGVSIFCDSIENASLIISLDKAFIGSNTSLIAPVTINEQSVVGAGSVISRKVNKKTLALTRTEQIEIKNYKRKK